MPSTRTMTSQETEVLAEAVEFADLADAIRAYGVEAALADYELDGQTPEEFAADLLESYPALEAL